MKVVTVSATVRVTAAFAGIMLAGALVLPTTTNAQTTEVWVGGTKAPALYDPNELGDNAIEDTIFDNIDQIVKVPYLRTLGLLTYPFVEPYNVSVNDGVTNLVLAVKAIRANDPAGKIVVTGVSQGGDVVARGILALEAEGYDTSNIVVLTQGNPGSNVGGIMNALPYGHVPFLGMNLGENTSPQYTPVTQIRNQYDAAVDMPQYFNLLSILNAALGFALGQHAYSGPLYGPSHVITTSADGLITDVFVPHTGLVPVLKALQMIGVPTEFLQAINAPVKDLIEMGYDRSYYGQAGMYPTTPVRMGILPNPIQIVHGLVRFVVDCLQSAQQLITMALPPASTQPTAPVQNNLMMSRVNATEQANDEVSSPEAINKPADIDTESRVVDTEPLGKIAATPQQSSDREIAVAAEELEIKHNDTPPPHVEQSNQENSVPELDDAQKTDSDVNQLKPHVISDGNKVTPGQVQQSSEDKKDEDKATEPTTSTTDATDVESNPVPTPLTVSEPVSSSANSTTNETSSQTNDSSEASAA